MGVDLSLGMTPYITELTHCNGCPLLYNRLSVPRMREAWGDIQKAANPWSGSVEWYGDDGLVKRSVDAYGEPITWIAPKVLAEILRAHGMHEWGGQGASIVAWLDALGADKDQKVFLYWH